MPTILSPMRLALLAALAVAGLAAPAGAQTVSAPRSAVRLSGPRAGVTLLSPDTVRRINDRFRDAGLAEGEGDVIDPTMPVVTQFGWQFETRVFQTPGGLTGLTEFVPLVGGLDRGILLPSATFLVGARTHDGIEFGVGPNVSATGVAYALAAGFNASAGEVNIPLNVAAAFGKGGPRVSLLVGMTFSNRRY
ncbi:MAG TPA: hypothetical protein VGB53_12360 [Rubricoccaceae bacterium]|jgi:hypothetical protein